LSEKNARAQVISKYCVAPPNVSINLVDFDLAHAAELRGAVSEISVAWCDPMPSRGRNMSYKTIMVHLTAGVSNQSRIALARNLAAKFDARLIGVAASELSPPLYFTDGGAGQKFIDEGEEAIKSILSALEKEFYEGLDRARFQSEWRSSREMPTQYIAKEARAADLIVTGSSRSVVLSDAFAFADSSDLVMEVGRPLLIVPDSVAWLDPRSCLVAWKETAEARRAIVDAMPFLRMAKEVSVVQAVEGGGHLSIGAAHRQVRDVVGWLGWHGISATPIVVEAERDVSHQLAQIGSDVGAGLIVAGAYGHSRLREWVFGGATRHFLQNSDRCVLLSR
jgi:nucleotide-binding universal stress UspA family protein